MSEKKPKRERRAKHTANIMQMKFVAAYYSHGNGAQAAIDAGYSEKSAASTAYDLLNNSPAVKALMDGILKKVSGNLESRLTSHLAKTEYLFQRADDADNLLVAFKCHEHKGNILRINPQYIKMDIELSGEIDIRGALERGKARAGLVIEAESRTVEEAVPGPLAGELDIFS